MDLKLDNDVDYLSDGDGINSDCEESGWNRTSDEKSNEEKVA